MIGKRKGKNVKEYIDDKILRLFRESTDKNKDKICPKNITLSDLEEAMGDSSDAQMHIKLENKNALWDAYYKIMLDAVVNGRTSVESSAFGDQTSIKITKNMNKNNFFNKKLSSSNKPPVWKKPKQHQLKKKGPLIPFVFKPN